MKTDWFYVVYMIYCVMMTYAGIKLIKGTRQVSESTKTS